MSTNDEHSSLAALMAGIVSAHVEHNTVGVSELSTLIAKVYGALAGLGVSAKLPATEPQQPAVSIRASIKPDYLVCLEDGKRMKLLKRHLMTEHQMTPADYRTKWELAADYPMIASGYASERRTLALRYGLGKGRQLAAGADVQQPTENAPFKAKPVAPLASPVAPPASAPRPKKSRLKIAIDKS